MRRTLPRLPALLAGSLLLAAPHVAGGAGVADENGKTYRVLFLTHSAGFEHGVIKREDPEVPSFAAQALARAAGERLEVVATKDCSLLASVDEFDAVLLYTTGELPVDESVRDGLFAWVAAGGALLGVHSATDTWYQEPRYGELIGGYFDGHPWHEDVGVRVEDREHPATAHLGDGFRIVDEIYQFKEFRRHPINVLLSLDSGGADLSKGKREDGDYALAWWRPYGRGRVFYSALGHRPEVWADERFSTHVIEAIAWAVDGPDVPAAAPAGVREQVLDAPAHRWMAKDGSELPWRVVDADVATLEVVPGGGDVVSTVTHRDALIHVEFRIPDPPGDERGNSGVYVHGRYEVQVLDSSGKEPGNAECGALYGLAAPAVNASRDPGEWQSYDIRFRAPRFGDGGAKTENARMSVWHNGLLIHDDVELPGPTPGGLTTRALRTGEVVDAPETDFAPLLLQDHGSRVVYRNVWILAR